MSLRFTPCPACARHVKQCDSRCPFCAAHVRHVNAPRRVAVRRLSRAALFAAGTAGLALATTDCGSSSISVPAYGSDAGIGEPYYEPGDAADAGSSTPADAASTDAAPVPLDGGLEAGVPRDGAPPGDASGDAQIGDASGDALDGSASSAADAATEGGSNDGGSTEPCLCPAYGGPYVLCCL